MTYEPVTDAGGAAAPGGDSGRGSPPRMPRWVKVFGIVIGVLVLLSVLRFTGLGPIHGGGHGGGGGHAPGHGTPPASLTPAGHAPAGGH